MSEANEAKKVHRKYSKLALDQGWRVEETHDGWKFLPGDESKGFVTLHKTPNRGRWQANFIGELRRRGLRIR